MDSFQNIDNKFIMILIGNYFFNKFIGHLFPFDACLEIQIQHVLSLYACYYEISIYVLTRSHKHFGKYLNSAVGS